MKPVRPIMCGPKTKNKLYNARRTSEQKFSKINNYHTRIYSNWICLWAGFERKKKIIDRNPKR